MCGLQHLPADEVPACGGFGLLDGHFSFTGSDSKVFRGSGECAKVDWTF